MKNKFKFSKEEREMLRNSLSSFKNDAIKTSASSVVGAGFSRSHSRSWGRYVVNQISN